MSRNGARDDDRDEASNGQTTPNVSRRSALKGIGAASATLLGLGGTAAAGSRMTDETVEDVTAEWNGSHHEEIFQQALHDFDIYDRPYMDKEASTPDTFNQMANGRLGIKDEKLTIDVPYIVDTESELLGSALKTVIDKYCKNYSQYYDPRGTTLDLGHPVLSDVEVTNVGMAPQAAQVFWEEFEDTGNTKYLAFSSHYLQDMAVPLHTGMGLKQANLEWDVDYRFVWEPDGYIMKVKDIEVNGIDPTTWIHYGVEAMAKYYWDRPYQGEEDLGPLRESFSGTETEPITSAHDASVKMAEYSSQYSENMFDKVRSNEISNIEDEWEGPGDWSEETEVWILETLEKCFEELGKYHRSFLIESGIVN